MIVHDMTQTDLADLTSNSDRSARTDLGDMMERAINTLFFSHHCLFGNFNQWCRKHQYLSEAAHRSTRAAAERGHRVGSYKVGRNGRTTKNQLVKAAATPKLPLSPKHKCAKHVPPIKNRLNRIRHHLALAVRRILSFSDLSLAAMGATNIHKCALP